MPLYKVTKAYRVEYKIEAASPREAEAESRTREPDLLTEIYFSTHPLESFPVLTRTTDEAHPPVSPL